jgi:hypothetical protein
MVTLTIKDKSWSEPSLESALNTLQTAEILDNIDLKIDDYYISIDDRKMSKQEIIIYLNI